MILGHKSSMPVYVTATALGKLGHPDGELNLTRAAGKHGVIQMVCRGFYPDDRSLFKRAEVP